MKSTVVNSSMTKSSLPSLKLCLILDGIGCLSYLAPGIGELFDIIWAPVSAVIFYFMFGKRLGVFGGIVEFVEELSPGFDLLPTFTIAWWLRKKNLM